VHVFPEQSQASPVAIELLTVQAHEKKKEKKNTQNPVFYGNFMFYKTA
jgi:hypothetical protein